MTPTPRISLAAGARGLVCPQCACRHFEVVYTRPVREGVMRVRACRHCGRRMTTREQVVGGVSGDDDGGRGMPAGPASTPV